MKGLPTRRDAVGCAGGADRILTLPRDAQAACRFRTEVNDLPSAKGLRLRAVKVEDSSRHAAPIRPIEPAANAIPGIHHGKGGQPRRAVASRRVSSAACQEGT